jgi:predicted nucleic acid-binding protein
VPTPEALVVDASMIVETLLGTGLGIEARGRMRGHELHAPAHLDVEVLSALGRLYRAGEVDRETVTTALAELAAAPIRRHLLASLLTGAWMRRDNQWLTDALYTELAATLDATAVLTTDARLARSDDGVELVTENYS